MAAQAGPDGASPDVDAPALRSRPAGAGHPARRACLASFRRVIVAWNGSREAARAAFDALPFIMEAEEHRGLGRRSAGEPVGREAGADIAAALRATARRSRFTPKRRAGWRPTR